MQAFKQQYLVLSAQTYRIEDEKTGRINEGISIRYITDNSLTQVKDETRSDSGNILLGRKVAKTSMPLDAIHKLKQLPCLYDVTLEMSIVADKQQIRVKDMEFISTVELDFDRPPA